MAVDPMMLAGGPAVPDAPLPPGMGGAPMGVGAPPGAPSPAEAVMQAVMGLVPAQQQAMGAMTMQVQDAVMQALLAGGNPAGLAAVTGPVAPGALDGAGEMGAPDGALEGEDEVY